MHYRRDYQAGSRNPVFQLYSGPPLKYLVAHPSCGTFLGLHRPFWQRLFKIWHQHTCYYIIFVQPDTQVHIAADTGLGKSENLHISVFSVMPIPLTIAWLVTKMYEQEADSKYCGQGYTFLSSYWILEGPRIAAVMVSSIALHSNKIYIFLLSS